MRIRTARLIPFDTQKEQPDVPYRVTDRSVLGPAMKRAIWAPALELIPRRISANSITIVSNLGSAVAFTAAILLVLTDTSSPLLLMLSGLALFLYMSLDNMDGSQARRTQTASPAGEFIDHWFDSLNLVLIMLAIFMVVEVPNWLSLAMVSVGCVGFFSQFWEQRHTDMLIFGRFGTIEAQLITILFYLMLAFTGTEWVTRPLAEGWPSLGLLTSLAVFAGGCVTLFAVVLRVRHRLRDFSPLLVALSLNFLWFALSPLPFLWSCAILLLANGYFSGRMVISRVTQGDYFGLDWIFVGLLLIPTLGVLWDMPLLHHHIFAATAVAYLLVRLIADFTFTLLRLERFLKDRELLQAVVKVARHLHMDRIGQPVDV